MYKVPIVIFLTLITISCTPKHTPERGIETDPVLMSRHIQCDAKNYKLVIQDSVDYSKDSPYSFYYPDKFKNCQPSILIISKLKTNTSKKVKFSDLYFGEHRSQTIYTSLKSDTLSFDYNAYHFDILKDTVLVNVKQ